MIKCNDCGITMDSTEAEETEGKCLICGGTNILVV